MIFENTYRFAVGAIVIAMVTGLYAAQDLAIIPSDSTVTTEGDTTIVKSGETTLRLKGFKITTATEVGNDQKLPITITSNGNKVLTEINWTITPAEAGSVEIGPTGSVLTYFFVPSDTFVGEVTIGVTGRNSRSQLISGELPIVVTIGAATEIVISAGEPISK